jgi:maleylacetoacetate isomerase
MKLYSFFGSSASYRARIASHLKGVPFETASIDLRRHQQRDPAYRAVNPQARLPALELDDGTIITQSLAIIDYLEATTPEPPIYPRDPVQRARAFAVALTIAADIHPLNNSGSVQDYLRRQMGQDQAQWDAWYAHWITRGFAAIEDMIEGKSFAFGDAPTVADICLVPQVFNARRFKVDISAFPKIVAVDAHASAHPAFAAAHPSAQPDAA